MYFIAAKRDGATPEPPHAVAVTQRFAGAEARGVAKPPQPGHAGGAGSITGAVVTIRIFQPAAQHLIAAADAEDLPAVAQMATDPALPPLAAQPGQVVQRAFAARQDDKIGRARIRGRTR